AVPTTISARADGRVIRLVPLAPLAAHTAYQIELTSGLQDASGRTASRGETLGGFTTGAATDGQPPVVTAVMPLNGASEIDANALIQVSFSEPINPSTVDGTS